jgi:Uma2 family endonuclease
MTDRVKTGVSLDELMQHEWVEVVNGVIVPMDVLLFTLGHRIITDEVYRVLKHHATEQQLGYVFGSGLTYALHIDANGIQAARIPDVSYICRDHLKHNFSPDGAYPGCPDLAVEVMSAREDIDTLLLKVGDYLRYGTQQVWMVDPECRAVYVYTAGEPTPRTYTETETLTAESLLGGFKIGVADLFAE